MLTELAVAIICACTPVGPYSSAARSEQTQIVAPPPPPAPPVLWTTESSNGACVGMLGALEFWNPGWDVGRMSRIVYRESRCDPNASNSCCSGILQIHRSWISQLGECGVFSRSDLYDPWANICAGAVVFREQGISAWSQTS